MTHQSVVEGDQVEERSGRLPTGKGWEAVVAADRPMLFRGAAADWKLVQAGLSGPEQAADVLTSSWSGRDLVVYRGLPEIGGRFFYTDAVDGFNFTGAREPLPPLLEELLAAADNPGAPSIYVGSSDLPTYFPGLTPHSGLDLAAIHPMLTEHPGLGSLWLGNRTVASCHYDASANIAVCAVGRRRFTLFPPDQVSNLYPGPLEPTPGGQVVSMVDFAAPDLQRFPRFAEAMRHAQIADLLPGDVLFYPALWWHHVEALDPFNVLVNYWWNSVPAYVDTPQTTLLHALASLRARPASEREAWRAVFDHYVFGDADLAAAHLPQHAQGPLGPLTETVARRLRANVTRLLQR